MERGSRFFFVGSIASVYNGVRYHHVPPLGLDRITGAFLANLRSIQIEGVASLSSKSYSLLPPDRFFGPDARQKEIAQHLYGQVASLPLVCPHGHVDPRMFADPNYSFGSPADLLIIPDHYVFRMLYSQGVPLEALGVPRRDGGPVETDHRKIWQTFADHFYLFRGTPTGVWLAQELVELFGVEEKLNSASAMRIYDQIADCLTRPEFRPRALFERFNIEVLATTDAAADPLTHHQAIKASGWKGRVVPTFRPDAAINIDMPGWRENIDALSAISEIEVEQLSSAHRSLRESPGLLQADGRDRDRFGGFGSSDR